MAAMSLTAPLVSYVCITRDREEMIAPMLEQFDAQSWPNRELIIVDDSRKPLGTRLPENSTYVRLDPSHHHSIPAKRNTGCAHASGQYIAWHDDDDWFHPDRVSLCLEAMEQEDIDLCGPEGAYWIDLNDRSAVYYYHSVSPFPVSGGVLFHRRCVERHPMRGELNRGSDTAWMMALCSDPAFKVKKLPRRDLFVAVSHGRNASNPRPPGVRVPELCVNQLEILVGAHGSTGISAHLERLAIAQAAVPRGDETHADI